eukprot:scaffold61_cov180-Ochromonas_danica.AAC.13
MEGNHEQVIIKIPQQDLSFQSERPNDQTRSEDRDSKYRGVQMVERHDMEEELFFIYIPHINHKKK